MSEQAIKEEATCVSNQLLTFYLMDQMFGIPVLQVDDVLGPQNLTSMPLSSSAIAGVMNLRGRIVTAIDVRRCLGQPSREDDSLGMSVVVEHNGELFSLLIDRIGDVLQLTSDTFENVPATLDPVWRSVSSGVHKLEDKILIILDVEQLLDIVGSKTGV